MLDTGWTCYSSKVNDPVGQEELAKINLLSTTIFNLEENNIVDILTPGTIFSYKSIRGSDISHLDLQSDTFMVVKSYANDAYHGICLACFSFKSQKLGLVFETYFTFRGIKLNSKPTGKPRLSKQKETKQ